MVQKEHKVDVVVQVKYMPRKFKAEYVSEVIKRPKWLCRWWLRTRPCKNAVQMNPNDGIPACIEFYVPAWAWPFELLHRAVFGKAKITT